MYSLMNALMSALMGVTISRVCLVIDYRHIFLCEGAYCFSVFLTYSRFEFNVCAWDEVSRVVSKLVVTARFGTATMNLDDIHPSEILICCHWLVLRKNWYHSMPLICPRTSLFIRSQKFDITVLCRAESVIFRLVAISTIIISFLIRTYISLYKNDVCKIIASIL